MTIPDTIPTDRPVTAYDVNAMIGLMRNRADLRCQILRWVSDDPFPGLVEASFTDGAGKVWTMVDKVSIFTSEPLITTSTFPRVGVVRCEVLERRTDSSGRVMVRVRAIDEPLGERARDFTVEEAKLGPPGG